MLTIGRAHSCLLQAYRGISGVVERLDTADFLLPTRCAAWTVGDVLFHVLHDAQRALVALGTPADGPPDVDFVTYWQGFSAGDPGALAHARAVRIGASAFDEPGRLVRLWNETSEAALRVAASRQESEHIVTQGLILSVPSFLATLAVEAVIHHLDMTVHLARAAPPGHDALHLARQTLDGLLGANVLADWSDTDCVLKGTGRSSLNQQDRAALGEHAHRFPLFS